MGVAAQCVSEVGPHLGWLIFGCFIVTAVTICVGLAIWQNYHLASNQPED